ncbi:FkbM family methyltransferase [Phytopseudomonas dryadis]|uniref:Methyltransferase FkbM domain-containing protein n=1 Tax=Phytopseudomonas dryadis TaxID=2487520 RepID=A0A4Q9R4G7_9GAMM|nr:FkbM family methyltransferase [Pseudomonas dryadis]TBU93900.1 hypothetical protein DNK44_09485 [Pseudomonas dryadis]
MSLQSASDVPHPQRIRSNLAAEYANRAISLMGRQSFAQAERYLSQAIELEPENAQWHLEMARLQRLQSPERARQAYATACALGSPCATFEAAALYAVPGAVEYVSPLSLWQADRLDIAVKLLYVRAYLNPTGDQADAARALYRRHILQRTNGREPESLGKTCLEDYERSFIALIESIRAEGLQEACAIPVDGEGRILNGAHRLAIALALGLKSVPVVRLPPPWKGLEWGMGWFLHYGFKPAEINRLLQCWIEAHPDRAGLLIIEHFGSGVAVELMAELAQRFRVLAWRDLCPDVKPSSPLCGSPALPRGPWRYVWVDATERALQALSTHLNEQYAGRLRCLALFGPSARAWMQDLLDEDTVAAWHSTSAVPASDASSIALWTGYVGESKVGLQAGGTGFVKWRNLQGLEDVHTIIDVGVANGTPDLYRNLSPEHVVFIEPVTIFRERIEELRAGFSSSQYLAVGLSSQDEEAIINYREDMPILTSLLKSSALRDTGNERITPLPVALRRLDAIFPTLQGIGYPILLKIDTGGHELEALRGGVESLKRIKYLMLEVPVIERFEGSYSCRELFEFLQRHGFILHTCLSASVDAEGFCRVIDAVFINTSLS